MNKKTIGGNRMCGKERIKREWYHFFFPEIEVFPEKPICCEKEMEYINEIALDILYICNECKREVLRKR